MRDSGITRKRRGGWKVSLYHTAVPRSDPVRVTPAVCTGMNSGGGSAESLPDQRCRVPDSRRARQGARLRRERDVRRHLPLPALSQEHARVLREDPGAAEARARLPRARDHGAAGNAHDRGRLARRARHLRRRLFSHSREIDPRSSAVEAEGAGAARPQRRAAGWKSAPPRRTWGEVPATRVWRVGSRHLVDADSGALGEGDSASGPCLPAGIGDRRRRHRARGVRLGNAGAARRSARWACGGAGIDWNALCVRLGPDHRTGTKRHADRAGGFDPPLSCHSRDPSQEGGDKATSP